MAKRNFREGSLSTMLLNVECWDRCLSDKEIKKLSVNSKFKIAGGFTIYVDPLPSLMGSEDII